IGRTRVLAQPAEHASGSVIRKGSEHLAPRGIVTFPTHHNQILRAGQRAEIAANAQRLARLRIVVQPRRATIAFRHHRPFQWILFGDNILGILRPKGDRKPLQKIHLKQAREEFTHGRSLFLPSPIVKPLSSTLVPSLLASLASLAPYIFLRAWYPLAQDGIRRPIHAGCSRRSAFGGRRRRSAHRRRSRARRQNPRPLRQQHHSRQRPHRPRRNHRPSPRRAPPRQLSSWGYHALRHHRALLHVRWRNNPGPRSPA